MIAHIKSIKGYDMQDNKNATRIHLIWAHPRLNSLTGRVVDAIKDASRHAGMEVCELDLYRSHFDPVLMPADEPDFQNSSIKKYSDEVVKLAESLSGSDAAIIVFPLWWYSLPAMLKGYIDRVWNYGLLYGKGKTLPFQKIRWIALVGGSQDHFEKEKRHAYLSDLLDQGIARYCGANDSKITFLYNTIAFEEPTTDLGKHHLDLIEEARSVVLRLASELASANPLAAE